MANVYVEKLSRDDVPLTNSTGADLAQFDVTVIAPYVAVADEDIASGDVGDFTVKDGLVLQANELVSGEDTFATVGQAVYFDPTSKELSDTSTAGYYLIGYLTQVKGSDGVIKFEKLRFATVVA